MFDFHLNVNYLISKFTGSDLVYPKSCSSEHDFLSSAHFLRLWLAIYPVQNSTKEWNDSLFLFWHLRHLPSFMRVSDYRLVWILHASPNPVTAPPPPSPIPHPPPADLRIDLPQEHCLTLQTFTVPWSPLCPVHLLSSPSWWSDGGSGIHIDPHKRPERWYKDEGN